VPSMDKSGFSFAVDNFWFFFPLPTGKLRHFLKVEKSFRFQLV
jgi:hypothetical protein